MSNFKHFTSKIRAFCWKSQPKSYPDFPFIHPCTFSPSLLSSLPFHPSPFPLFLLPALPSSPLHIQEQCERPGPLLRGERPGLPEACHPTAPLSSLPAGPQHAWHDDEDAVWFQGPLRWDEEEWVRRMLWHPFTPLVGATPVSPNLKTFWDSFKKTGDVSMTKVSQS